jgi:glucose/mannose-6-phosphate isomerase
MGASGISGDIVKELFRDKIDVPIYVNRQYDLPKWAKKDTLNIFISYSGNTEETLSAFKVAYQKKCKIICISSGGKLQEFAEKRQVSHIKVPGGLQPRAATGYLLFILLMILKRTYLIKNDIDSDIQEVVSVTQDLVNTAKKEEKNNFAKQISLEIFETFPQIYAFKYYEPIAKRWRQQFNENGKIVARYDVVSESNHNDIVGWSGNKDMAKNSTAIIFRDKEEETIYMSTRLDFLESLFKDIAKNVIEIQPKGKSRLAKIMYVMLLGDFISCYLAILRKIDPTPVDIITELKKRLAEI